MADDEIVSSFFVTHIGTVTVNNYGAVIFAPNAPTKVIIDVQTLHDITRGVNDAVKAFKRNGQWRR
jgi:hypothetical protein